MAESRQNVDSAISAPSLWEGMGGCYFILPPFGRVWGGYCFGRVGVGITYASLPVECGIWLSAVRCRCHGHP